MVERRMTVVRKEDQGDRILLFSAPRHGLIIEYYVIASHKDGESVSEGDMICYEPAGVNFGWYLGCVQG